MSRTPQTKLDAPAAWKEWTTSGSADAAAQFLDRVASWTHGTAAQLTRGARHLNCHPTRDDIVARLRHHLSLVAGGEPVPYLTALEVARRNVIEDLRAGRPAEPERRV
jgi:hypothetical protein